MSPLTSVNEEDQGSFRGRMAKAHFLSPALGPSQLEGEVRCCAPHLRAHAATTGPTLVLSQRVPSAFKSYPQKQGLIHTAVQMVCRWRNRITGAGRLFYWKCRIVTLLSKNLQIIKFICPWDMRTAKEMILVQAFLCF